MTKTKNTAPRVRTTNLYTVESDGQPVAQAMAISQAEAVRLYVESVQQPTMSARLSSPLEARTLAGLPLLTRGEPVRDTATPDLFDGAPAAPVSPAVGAVVDPVLLATYCPPVELPVKTYSPEVPVQIVAELAPGNVEDEHALAAVPPQHATIEAVLEDLASGEPMPSALSTAALTVVHAPAAVELPDTDEPTQAECRRLFRDLPKGAGQPVAKYRNPDDGSTWSGRGLKPRWLMAAQEMGRTMNEFLI